MYRNNGGLPVDGEPIEVFPGEVAMRSRERPKERWYKRLLNKVKPRKGALRKVFSRRKDRHQWDNEDEDGDGWALLD